MLTITQEFICTNYMTDIRVKTQENIEEEEEHVG